MVTIHEFTHDHKAYELVWGKRKHWCSARTDSFSEEHLKALGDFYQTDGQRVWWEEDGSEEFSVREK